MDKKLIKCGLAGLVIATSSAPAATVFSTITPLVASEGILVTVNVNASLGPVNDGIDDITFQVQDLGENSSITVVGENGSEVSSLGIFDVDLYGPGDSVGGSATYSSSSDFLAIDNSTGFSLGNWAGGETGYVGISLQIAGETHYGFVRVTWNPDNNGATADSTAIIDQIGFNTVAGEAAIIPVPEPSGIMFLLVGCLPVWLRKR